MRRLSFMFFLAVALWAASSSASRAEFRVCNSSGAEVRVAFGNNDPRFGWTSRGWWSVPAGACQDVLFGEVARGNYYVYSLDGANRAIAVPDAQTGGTFCVKDGAFDLRSNAFMTPQNAIACEAHGLKSIKFRAVEVNDAAADYSYTLPANTVAATSPNASGLSAIVPVIQGVVQNLPKPAPPPAVTAAPPPVPVAQTPSAQQPVQRPQGGAGTACQRYPNLC